MAAGTRLSEALRSSPPRCPGSSAATRAADPHPPRRSLDPLPSEPKKPLARGLTETPGPCCQPAEGLRPRGRCAGLGKRTKGGRYQAFTVPSEDRTYEMDRAPAGTAIRAWPTKTGCAGAGRKEGAGGRKRLPLQSAPYLLEVARRGLRLQRQPCFPALTGVVEGDLSQLVQPCKSRCCRPPRNPLQPTALPGSVSALICIK